MLTLKYINNLLTKVFFIKFRARFKELIVFPTFNSKILLSFLPVGRQAILIFDNLQLFVMKQFSAVLILCTISITLFSQSTAIRVYDIFQSNCVNCHSNANPRAGLDLEGSGSSKTAKALSVYNNLVGKTASNNTAAAKGYQLVHPGRVDKSFLFKKINRGLDMDMELEGGENDPMPLSSSLTDVEKELIRQWILFGAPTEGEVIKETVLKEYYESGKGRASFPEGAPPAPDPSEGFQIKMGPFFIDPSGEDEFYSKFQLDNTAEIEVKRLDIKMSTSSHHFIIYDYDSAANDVPAGFRRSQDHTQDVSFVATVQESQDITLPKNTAFKWGKNHVLDLNSHTINYLADNIYQNEVYINIYTQPLGTAKQEIQADLVPYPWINIPNNGNEITHSSSVRFPGKLFVWNIAGHTHRYGTGYKIWLNDSNGNRDELIYDGACPRGVPNCVAPFFDYQHIPTLTFDEFLPINFSHGITHEATWINDGPESVRWGSTSQDEMMLFAMLYVTDTTGLGIGNVSTPTFNLENPLNEIVVMPNPMQEMTTIVLPNDIGAINFRLVDMLGKEIQQLANFQNKFIQINRDNLPSGMYLFTVENEIGQSFTGKILME